MATFPNELSFIKGHISTLASLSLAFPDNHQPSLSEYSRKVGVFPVELPQPPERRKEASSTSSDTISITFKSAKPPLSFPLTVSTVDTIATIKQQLASQPRAPAAGVQRLLLKGKALADAKLLKEYGVTDGATINLMVKPGTDWDGSETLSATKEISLSPSNKPLSPDSTGIPAVVISSESAASGTHSSIPLELNTSFPCAAQPSMTEVSTFHTTISSPGFWDRLHLFLRTEFANKDDAGAAFEQFLVASKGSLSVGEIAKIRDQVGVVGMAGT
ncbi:hypothetical protein BU17DRAFT_84868 [Hysterangium stoloniferum]|nr:hypothetical protein BU17DRAFT_84868 [Hysterangium stoloniferum]